MSWSDDDIAKLKDCVAKGWSAGETARMLPGHSRNAVIGKAHRIGLRFGAVVGEPKKKARGGFIRVDAVKPYDPSKDTKAKAAAPVVAVAPDPEPDPDFFAGPLGQPYASVEGGKRLVDLKFGECRFYLGHRLAAPEFFCGQPVKVGKPYCPDCCGRAYQKTQPRAVDAAEPKHARPVPRWGRAS